MSCEVPHPPARPPAPATDADYLPYFTIWQRDGDVKARDLLVERYMPLARSLARRYVTAREPLDDLVQVASYGLLRAIDRFDPAHGAGFSSFAVPTILGEIRRYLRDHAWPMHVPRSAQEGAMAVETAIRQLTAGSRRDPTITEMATHLGWTVEAVLDALQVSADRTLDSLDIPVERGESSEGTLADTIGAEDQAFAQVESQLNLGAAADSLPVFARDVLRLRFVEDLSQAEIAARVGVSQMKVSRILRDALDQLRTSGHFGTEPTPRPD